MPVLLIDRRDSEVDSTRIEQAREIANALERQRELEAEERRREEYRRRIALETQAREEGLRRELQQRLAREREEREIRERIERDQLQREQGEEREQRGQEERRNQSIRREVIMRRKAAEKAERLERKEALDRIERERELTLKRLEANKSISHDLATATQERKEALRTEIAVHIEHERRQREQRARQQNRLQQVYEESQKWPENIIPTIEAIIKEEASRSVVVSVQETAQVENNQLISWIEIGNKGQEC
ncbi:hypothetical protein EV426DRAFT_708905 [Tirmania nivea]|nr:hypothetical protein EV426DRAFT_708905 [Tirmania nivea]